MKRQDETRRRSRRDEQARLTREAMVETAHRLFARHGYAATSVRAVADEAGVSEQTVYRVFGDKPGLLRAVVLAAVGGPGNTEALRESPMVEALAAETDASMRLRMVARWVREGYDRGLADLENVVQAAAPADERVEDLARFMAEQRYEDTRRLVLEILGNEQPPGMEVGDVVDYVYAVESSPVFSILASERGWTPEKYADWFVHMFERMFLVPQGGRRPS